MSTIATIDFDTAHYDRDVDVPYLSVGDPSRTVDFDETPVSQTSEVRDQHARDAISGDARIPRRTTRAPCKWLLRSFKNQL